MAGEYIYGFYEDITALQSTYGTVESTLGPPMSVEVSRTIQQIGDQADLWPSFRFALDDSVRIVTTVTRVVEKVIVEKTFGHNMLRQLEDGLTAREISRLQQLIQHFNNMIAPPIRMICVMFQLERQSISADQRKQPDAKLASLGEYVQRLSASLPKVTHTVPMSEDTLMGSADDEDEDIDNKYTSLMRRLLVSVATVAQIRSPSDTALLQLEGDLSVQLTSDMEIFDDAVEYQTSMTPGEILRSSSSNSVNSIMMLGTGSQFADRTAMIQYTNHDKAYDYEVTMRYLNLARDYVDRDNYKGAQHYYTEALALLEKHRFFRQTDPNLTNVELMLARSYIKQEKHDEAIEVLEPVANKRGVFSRTLVGTVRPGKESLNQFPASDELLAIAASHILGEVYLRIGNYKEAESYTQKVFVKRSFDFGNDNEETLASVRQLVEIYRAMGNDQKAQAYENFLPHSLKAHDSLVDFGSLHGTISKWELDTDLSDMLPTEPKSQRSQLSPMTEDIHDDFGVSESQMQNTEESSTMYSQRVWSTESQTASTTWMQSYIWCMLRTLIAGFQLHNLGFLVESFSNRPVKADQKYIYWECGCGQRLSTRVNEHRAGAAEALVGRLSRKQAVMSSVNTFGRDHQDPAELSLGTDEKGKPVYDKEPLGDTQYPSNDGLGSARDNSQPSIATAASVGALAARDSRFLLLCINLSKHEIVLEQINLDTLDKQNDMALFTEIRRRYSQAQMSLVSKWLVFLPSKVHLTKFQLVPRQSDCWVGILQQPSVPPPDEVLVHKRYHYVPCPMDTDPYLPMNDIFLHAFFDPREHTTDFWLDSLPKRLHEELVYSSKDIPAVGWGIHIEECVNIFLLSLLVLLVLVLTSVFCLCWAILRHGDVQGAFGIGSYLVAIEMAMLSAVFFYLQSPQTKI